MKKLISLIRALPGWSSGFSVRFAWLFLFFIGFIAVSFSFDQKDFKEFPNLVFLPNILLIRRSIGIQPNLNRCGEHRYLLAIELLT